MRVPETMKCERRKACLPSDALELGPEISIFGRRLTAVSGADPLRICSSRHGLMLFDVYAHSTQTIQDQAVAVLDSMPLEAACTEPMDLSGQISGQTDAAENTKTRNPLGNAGSNGGGEGTRTPGLLHAKQALYQLSYTPDILSVFSYTPGTQSTPGERSVRVRGSRPRYV